MNALQKLVTARRATLGLSLKQAAERAEHLVSGSTLNAIETGRHVGQLHDRTIAGIAIALDLEEALVREAAGAASARHVEFRLPEKASRLGPNRRRLLLKYLDILVQLEDAEDDLAAEDEELDTTTQSDGRATQTRRSASSL